MSSIDQLIQLQRDLLSILLKYQNRFSAKNTSEITPGYLHTIGQRVDDIFNNFEGQHNEILQKVHDEEIDPCDVPYLCDDCYFEFSEQYFIFKGKIMDALSQHSVAYSPLSSTFVAPNTRADTTIGVDTKLPKISLPTFTGDYMEWIPFRDIYVSLVHSNESLNKIQKFYYLKGTLAGEAARLIKTISATEANYDSAWNTLESRYHNRRIIVGHLISRLFNIEKSIGNFQSIKTLLDSTKECLASLQNLGIDTSSWDPILVHLIAHKLDIETRKDWEHSLNSSTEIPTRSVIFDFLERTFRTLESIHDDFSSASRQKSNKPSKYSSLGKKTTVHIGRFSKPQKCVYCDKPHSLSKCFKFLALPLSEKNIFLLDKKACKNCLVIGHSSDQCSSPFRCIICKKLHHTVLHTDARPEQVNASNNFTLSTETGQITSHNVNTFASVLLYTIRLYIRTHSGFFPLRALLDPGSQGTLISESAVQLLGLRKQKSHCNVIGIGDGHTNFSKYSVSIDLYSKIKQPVLSCRALVLSNLFVYIPQPSSKHVSMTDLPADSLETLEEMRFSAIIKHPSKVAYNK